MAKRIVWKDAGGFGRSLRVMAERGRATAIIERGTKGEARWMWRVWCGGKHRTRWHGAQTYKIAEKRAEAQMKRGCRL